MRRAICLLSLLHLSIFVAMGQSVEQEVEITSHNEIPQTTVVMPQAPWHEVGEREVVVADSKRGASRKSRREERVAAFRSHIDSLVKGREFIFWPNSMRQLPSGDMRMIYNGYYYFALVDDHVEVHLPVEVGETHLVEMENFDSMSIENYFLSPLHSGWNIRFNIDEGERLCRIDFVVSTITGETILTLSTPQTEMRYVGCIREIKRE